MLVYTNSFLFVNNSFRILSFSVTTTSSAKRLRCLKYQVKLIKSKLYFVKENNMSSKKTQKLSNNITQTLHLWVFHPLQ